MQGFSPQRRRLGGVALALVATAAALPARAQTPPEVQAAADQWLAQTDAGAHGEAWVLAGAVFRGAVGQAQWQAAARQVLAPLGSVQRREPQGGKATPSLPGMPDGRYHILSFRTDFSHKAGAIETLTLALEADGQWRVVGYFVR